VDTAMSDNLQPRNDAGRSAAMPDGPEILHIPVGTSLAEAERSIIFATLRHCSGNKTRAAALLGVSLKTLYNRLNAYRAQGIEDMGASSHELMEGAL
jgi:DNA-binding NtrC family response regulator